MNDSNNITFDKRMRTATREIHSRSDALVNAKLALTLSNNEVWAEGILVFYEIFRYLEEAVQRHKGTIIEEIFIDNMYRTEAFENDLTYYLGNDWKKTYEIRESVASYLNHLRKVEEKEPLLLIAYIYHLYMGLLSGGQILRYKKLSKSTEGNCITDFGGIQISSLKKELRERVNLIAERLSEADKIKLIEESKTVFILNNTIIRSVKSSDVALRKKLMIFLFIIIFLIFIYLVWTH